MNNQLKEELKKLIESRQSKATQHPSDAYKGISYIEVERQNQKVDIPITQITINSSLSF